MNSTMKNSIAQWARSKCNELSRKTGPEKHLERGAPVLVLGILTCRCAFCAGPGGARPTSLLPSTRCASIRLVRRTDQGTFRSSFAPRFFLRDPGHQPFIGCANEATLSFRNTCSPSAQARATEFLLGPRCSPRVGELHRRSV